MVPLDKIGLGVMCKVPRSGLSKTRLGKHIGYDMAAALAGAFLRDVMSTANRLVLEGIVEQFVFFTPAGVDDELRKYVGSNVPLVLQDDADLGAAMLGALRHMLKKCPRGAILIGSDLPTLPAEVIAAAAGHLLRRGARTVFGPAEDGGFYLIGSNQADVASLLAPMAWSHADVMTAMRARAAASGLEIAEVATWYDVDDLTDLQRLKHELDNAEPDRARHTRAVLGSL